MQQDVQIIRNKNENIEILRAAAILLVMLVHVGVILVFPSSLYQWLNAHFDGNVGVDLFFVISGFVIAKSLLDSFSSDHLSRFTSIVAFWIKRAFRLIPAAFLGLLVVVLYFLATGDLWDGQHLRLRNLIPVAAACANIFNFYNAHCVAHPNDTTWCNTYFFYGHYWSLSLEAQFYMVFPFVLGFLKKRAVILLMILLIAVQFFWARPYWTYGWFFRTDGFCWGILLALLSVSGRRAFCVDRCLKNKTVVLILSFMLIFLLPISSSQVQGFGNEASRCGVALLAVISAALVFLADHPDARFGTWRPYRRVMLYIGSRSYSLYITHLIVFVLVKHLWSVAFGDMQFSVIDKRWVNIAVMISSLIITFISAEMTYRLVELKFRMKGRELAKDFMNHRIMGWSHA